MKRCVCLVCGYGGLVEPPSHQMICPSCGTQFGHDDRHASYQELRDIWVAAGAQWFSDHTPPPHGWNWREQPQVRHE